ncbi:radical SAM protein [Candidatus Woesearchaeota archaeon]|nr:radical SAM protein [Candidatus Woesearchaeota archaeon]
MEQKRLLLSAVFGPYGVKNKYAEGIGMQMEILNNQITREQGVHSHRANIPSYGLYMLAENISVPTTVLDFPKWKDFVKELKKGYTHVGISFIIPNVLKAKRMAEYIRKNYQKTKIILGGFGAMISELRDLIPCDEICHGEGIRWLRGYFGEDTGAPIKHPIITATVKRHSYGYKLKNHTAEIFPGLGCKNGCSFCATSHNFGAYVPYIQTGKEMFAACQEAEKKINTQLFGIMDENFLKEPTRAKELLIEMEKHSKPYTFGVVFASAEMIKELGVDFLVRLGVETIWIGAESKKSIFKKTEGTNLHRLIDELQSKGIKVIASTILFLEHHDKKYFEEDVDWAIGLGADMHQFMQLIAYPGTPIHQKFAEEGKLIKDFPYTKMHGQDVPSLNNSDFSPGEAKELTKEAFRKKYEIGGPATLNMCITAVRGYKRAKEDIKAREKAGLCWNPEKLKYEKTENPGPDKFMKKRLEMMKKEALSFRPTILVSKIFAPNKASRKKSDMARSLYNEAFGKPTLKDKSKSIALLGFATIEAARIWVRKLLGKGELIRQPPTKRIEYIGGKPVSHSKK